jgi:predicted transcriptional regulator
MVNFSTQMDNTFFALSSSVRRELLQNLQAGPQRLVDIAARLGLSLPALHKHIAILERAKLIYKRKIGRERFVMTNLATLQSADDWIRCYTSFWNNQFESLDNYIDSLEHTK